MVSHVIKMKFATKTWHVGKIPLLLVCATYELNQSISYSSIIFHFKVQAMHLSTDVTEYGVPVTRMKIVTKA